MTSDAQRIVDAYFEAIRGLVAVIGTPPDGDDTLIPSSIDTDQIPATVLNAGHTAIRFLAVGHGIAEGTADLPLEQAISADQFLQQLTAKDRS